LVIATVAAISIELSKHKTCNVY